MDTDSASSSLNLRFHEGLTYATPMTTLQLSSLSAPVAPGFTQEHKGSLMQYTAYSAQIGQQITQIILTSSDPHTLLARIARALGEIFQVDVCLIGALAKQDESLIINPFGTAQISLWCAQNVPALSRATQAQLLEYSTVKTDWEDSEPLAIRELPLSTAISSVGDDAEVLPPESACSPIVKAVLSIHTRFQSSINGIIVLGRSQPHEWTTPEKDWLKIAAESVALAISQVQLTQQVVGLTRFQTLLNQLSLRIRSTPNLDESLQLAIASTAKALGLSRGLILLLSYTEPPLKSRSATPLPTTEVTIAGEWFEETSAQAASTTSNSPRLLNQSFWLSESFLCQKALRDAPAPIVMADGRDSSAIDLRTENLSILEREMMPALLMLPLLGVPSDGSVAQEVLGFLVLQHHQPRLWHTDELEFVQGVSIQVSATVIQNQTLRQVQSLVDERTSQLERSLDVQAKLYEKTLQQIDQLQQLNQLKEEFMSTMSHELRTPLTAMSLAIRMLRQPTLPAERRNKYLEILEQECNKEIELINDLLSLQRLEADQTSIQPQKIDLIRLINELAQSFQEKWADKKLTLVVDAPVRSPTSSQNRKSSTSKAQSLMLNTDPDSLNRILLELLTNAGKYSDPDTTVRLQVTHQIHPSVNQVVLTLSNIGSGISPTDLGHIFDKFRRGQGVTQQAVQGTGLGLALVKCLVQYLNGAIAVSSCPLENSPSSVITFTLTLPQWQQPL